MGEVIAQYENFVLCEDENGGSPWLHNNQTGCEMQIDVKAVEKILSLIKVRASDAKRKS